MIKVYEQRAIRDGYGEGLVKVGAKNPNCFVLDADLAGSTRSVRFAREVSRDRFKNRGIAEQDLVATAAGIAGLPWETEHFAITVFASSFACFITERAFQQVKMVIDYDQRHVILIGSHGGLVGEDGHSHHGIYDIGLMRALPNMTVLVPCDAEEARKATIACDLLAGPKYLRLNRDAVPGFTAQEDLFVIGRANELRPGNEVTIIACGTMVYPSLLAAEILEKNQISARVLNMHTIKPLDSQAILQAARETGAIVTVEEHSVINGLGAAVSECVEKECPVLIKRIGIPDIVTRSGPIAKLREAYGLTPENIADAATQLHKARRKQ